MRIQVVRSEILIGMDSDAGWLRLYEESLAESLLFELGRSKASNVQGTETDHCFLGHRSFAVAERILPTSVEVVVVEFPNWAVSGDIDHMSRQPKFLDLSSETAELHREIYSGAYDVLHITERAMECYPARRLYKHAGGVGLNTLVIPDPDRLAQVSSGEYIAGDGGY